MGDREEGPDCILNIVFSTWTLEQGMVRGEGAGGLY